MEGCLKKKIFSSFDLSAKWRLFINLGGNVWEYNQSAASHTTRRTRVNHSCKFFYGLDCRSWFLLFIILQLTINDYNWNWCLFFIQSDFLLRLERPKNWNCFWNCNINLRTISIIEIISQMSGMTFVNKKYATVILEARIKTENSNLRHLQQKRLNHIYYDKWYKKFWPNTVSASSM